MVVIDISQVVATAITKEVTIQLNDIHNYQPGLTTLSRGRAVLEEVPRILPQISYPIEEDSGSTLTKYGYKTPKQNLHLNGVKNLCLTSISLSCWH
jgi:hypothetical protein